MTHGLWDHTIVRFRLTEMKVNSVQLKWNRNKQRDFALANWWKCSYFTHISTEAIGLFCSSFGLLGVATMYGAKWNAKPISSHFTVMHFFGVTPIANGTDSTCTADNHAAAYMAKEEVHERRWNTKTGWHSNIWSANASANVIKL